MASSFPDADEKAGYDEMMMERFAVFAFKVHIPRVERSPNHSHCGKCCASFYLAYDCASVPPPALLAPPLAQQSVGHAVANLAHELLLLQQMHSVGALSAAEFTVAKAKLLCWVASSVVRAAVISGSSFDVHVEFDTVDGAVQ